MSALSRIARRIVAVALGVAASGLATSTPARAGEPSQPRRFAEMVQGVSLAAGTLDKRIGGGEGTSTFGYRDLVGDASFKWGVRAGLRFPLGARWWIAPEGEVDLIPVALRASYVDWAMPSSSWRERALVGVRLAALFASGSFYLRLAAGIDHMGISGDYPPPSTVSGWSSSATGYTVEPGLGGEIDVGRYVQLGIAAGFPIAKFDFGYPYAADFVGIDVDVLVTAGARF
jgi:hypothetical protein